jgi:hypothetical protein
MLAYSPDSEPSRAFLLRAYNDLEIYVEDVASQNMYVRLFNRMLDGLGTISNVFPLHDRSRVIAACQAIAAVPSQRGFTSSMAISIFF